MRSVKLSSQKSYLNMPSLLLAALPGGVRLSQPATLTLERMLSLITLPSHLRQKPLNRYVQTQSLSQKFSEGRWIQQASSLEELARETTTRIPRQLKNYARIGVLRAHSLADLKVKYELVEIPVAVLRLVAGLTADDFSPRTPQGGSTARVLRKGLPAFTLRLDGSDGKVSLTNLDLALCRVHATWTVPVVGVDSVEEVI